MPSKPKSNSFVNILKSVGIVIAAILAALGALASFTGITVQEYFNKYELSYQSIANTELLEDAVQTGNVSLSVDGASVPEAYLHVIKVENTGTLRIASADFDTLPTFVFQGKLLTKPKILETSVTSLKPALDVQGNSIAFATGYLPKEWFTFEVLTDSSEFQTQVRTNQFNEFKVLSSADAEGLSLSNTLSTFFFMLFILLAISAFLEILRIKGRLSAISAEAERFSNRAKMYEKMAMTYKDGLERTGEVIRESSSEMEEDGINFEERTAEYESTVRNETESKG